MNECMTVVSFEIPKHSPRRSSRQLRQPEGTSRSQHPPLQLAPLYTGSRQFQAPPTPPAFSRPLSGCHGHQGCGGSWVQLLGPPCWLCHFLLPLTAPSTP